MEPDEDTNKYKYKPYEEDEHDEASRNWSSTQPAYTHGFLSEASNEASVDYVNKLRNQRSFGDNKEQHKKNKKASSKLQHDVISLDRKYPSENNSLSSVLASVHLSQELPTDTQKTELKMENTNVSKESPLSQFFPAGLTPKQSLVRKIVTTTGLPRKEESPITKFQSTIASPSITHPFLSPGRNLSSSSYFPNASTPNRDTEEMPENLSTISLYAETCDESSMCLEDVPVSVIEERVFGNVSPINVTPTVNIVDVMMKDTYITRPPNIKDSTPKLAALERAGSPILSASFGGGDNNGLESIISDEDDDIYNADDERQPSPPEFSSQPKFLSPRKLKLQTQNLSVINDGEEFDHTSEEELDDSSMEIQDAEVYPYPPGTTRRMSLAGIPQNSSSSSEELTEELSVEIISTSSATSAMSERKVALLKSISTILEPQGVKCPQMQLLKTKQQKSTTDDTDQEEPEEKMD